MSGIEALDLVDRGAGVLGQREDVDLAPGIDQPLADGGVPQRVDRVRLARMDVPLQPSAGQ